MSTIFLMPNWEDGFQGWMERIMDCVRDDLAAVIVKDTKGERHWKGKIPAFSLDAAGKEIRIFSRLFRLAKLSLETLPQKGDAVMYKTIRELENARIFCQYGIFAARFMNIWRETSVPLFIHFHGYDTFINLTSTDKPGQRVHPEDYLSRLKELENRAVFIAGSNFLKSQLVNAGISPENVLVKYYGIPIPVNAREYKNKEKITILHLGRFVDFKSPDRTIAAFEIAKSKGLKGQLLMVGNGPLKTTCELMRIRSHYKDDIRIIDPVYGVGAQNIYENADIYTQHNIYGEITGQAEGFGVSIVEAMASGLPFVGTKNGGVLETVIDGETGFLVEPGDVEAQAGQFLELAKSPELREKIGRAGRIHVEESFNPEKERIQLQKILGI